MALEEKRLLNSFACHDLFCRNLLVGFFVCLFLAVHIFFGLKRMGSGSDIFWPQFSSIKNVCLAYMSAISNRRVVPEWEY